MMMEMLNNMTWLGHDGFIIKTQGKTIVIDPYVVKQSEPADILCITHDHYDHCSVEDLEKFLKPGTVIITEPMSAAKLKGDVRGIAPGESVTLGDITITAVPSYNTNKAFHPKSNNWLGFIIQAGGTRLYHAGDTDLIPEMEGLKVDIALLPVSGTYVMTWQEAVDAAKKIRPAIAVPMHYDSIVGTKDDATSFAKALKGVCEVKIF